MFEKLFIARLLFIATVRNIFNFLEFVIYKLLCNKYGALLYPYYKLSINRIDRDYFSILKV